ncbi:MAG TPA: AAA family ATPase, partial [Polyangiales bacterium]|nr:AAA family ATPase [Polyangiales bacterium]
MPKQLENDETEDEAIGSFSTLLKRAARVSGPSVSGFHSTFVAGARLVDERLHVERRIGEGGMGVVYVAYDQLRRSQVALKTMNRLDAGSVYQLKYEFRSLADVCHPNLCRLHELFSELGQWFFTMELVDGERFDRWVRPDGVLDEARLRAALGQLCDAVSAIHAAGKLHRDLKPSNVLVARDGRVVVLDFGLTADGDTLVDGSVSGTPSYMAPEQAGGRAQNAASDMYSVGVMLFEALTGQLPFDGSLAQVLSDKQQRDAPAVASLNPEAPADLAALCDRWLARDPLQRPAATALRTPRAARGAEHEALVGRDAELAQLRAAYAAASSGTPVVVFVAGESGMGKSALVAHFLDGLRKEREAVVLAGRCYERESVPYKAFDAVLDDLSRYLRGLTRHAAGELLPREVFALARLFPALERVAAIADAPRREVSDVQELQLRAFAAFGELCARIRERRPLVIYVDDLQWSDHDSTVFMTYLLAQRRPVPLLLIASHRAKGAAEHPLTRIFEAARGNPSIDCRSLSIAPLSAAAAQQLAQRMLGDAAQREGDAALIATEAQGSPFFVGELVRQARIAGAFTLRDAVLRHVQGLGPGARSLLDVLAVAGRPLSVQLALDAAQTAHDAVDVLLEERLARAANSGEQRMLECYHDKIRESAVAAPTHEALQQLHRRLAITLTERAAADPEHLALHWHGAGDDALAASYYEQAGDRSAGGSLAFERAAKHFELALELGQHEPVRERELRVKL